VSATILLVDDEPEVRRLLQRMLGQLGFTVLAAENGPTALTLLAAHAGEIHLLVTDLDMPGMTGTELARTFHTQRPGAAVLYLSGYAEDAAGDGAGLLAGFLQKPFTAHQLAGAVSGLLDRSRA
jgi:CheY-like chemotaxis protein